MSMNCRESGVGSRESGVLESWSLGVLEFGSLEVFESGSLGVSKMDPDP